MQLLQLLFEELNFSFQLVILGLELLDICVAGSSQTLLDKLDRIGGLVCFFVKADEHSCELVNDSFSLKVFSELFLFRLC